MLLKQKDYTIGVYTPMHNQDPDLALSVETQSKMTPTFLTFYASAGGLEDKTQGN
jgi:hypothetical protein